MGYEVKITRRAEKFLSGVPQPDQSRIREKIASLATTPRPPGYKKLRGHDGLLRVRVGDYRVIYDVNDVVLKIEVVKVGDRKDIYD